MGIKSLFKRITSIASAVVIAASAAFVVTATTPSQSDAAASFAGYKKDCNSNSIIYCGASTTSELYTKYKKSTSAQHVYSAYGISSSDVANLGKTAVAGYATKSGNVYLSNGQLVATNAYSAGYHKEPGRSYKHTYAGTTYYNTYSQDVFLSSQIHGWIVMKYGVFQYMILASCGNPLTGKPTTKPNQTLVCTNLTATHVDRDTVKFTFSATPSKGATVGHFALYTGDGKSYTIGAGGKTTKVTKTFTKNYTTAKTYKAYVRVAGQANGKTVTNTNSNCAVTVTVKPAPTPQKPEMCKVPGKTNLKASDKNCYKTVTVTKVVTKVVKVNVVPPCPVPGKSNIKADNKDCYAVKTVNVCTVNGKTIEVTDSNVNICTTIVTKTVKVVPPCQVEGKENLKANDKDCVKVVTQTKEVKVPVTKVVTQTKVVKEQPKELVNTGPGDVLGIFAATAVIATIGSRLYLRRRYNA